MKVQLSGHYGYGRIINTVIPSVAMIMVTSVYTMVDGFFISNFAGSTAFASINIIWPAISIIAALGLMTGAGGSALVSKLFGEGKDHSACQAFTLIVRFSLILGTVLSVLFFAFMKPLVVALGAEGGMVPHAVMYGRIMALSLPLYIIQMVFQFFYMTAERPELGTRMSIICGLSNIGLDALFVVGFGWGLAGAAVASAVTLGVSGLFPLIWFRSKRNNTHLKFVSSRPDWPVIWQSCSNGISEFVGNIALNVVGICYNLQLMKYIGENGVSAYGIIMYIGFLFASVFIGYNISISQIVSFNYGAGNKAELRSLLRKSLFIVSALGVGLTVLAEIAAGPIARIFVGYDAALCDLTVHAMRLYMLSFLICGVNMFTSAWFTALNNGIVSAIAAFTRTLVFEMAAIFVLPLLVGIDGIWNAVNAAEVLALALAVSLILGFRKRYGY